MAALIAIAVGILAQPTVWLSSGPLNTCTAACAGVGRECDVAAVEAVANDLAAATPHLPPPA